MELSNPSLQIISPATARFRLLVDALLVPTHPARLVSYKDGEAQFSIERPGKPPIFIVLIDGSREEDRSLRLRIGRLATENVGNQHIVLCANHSWMPEALKKISEEFWPKMQVYQFNSEAELELKAKQPLDELQAIFKAQKAISLPAVVSSPVAIAPWLRACVALTASSPQKVVECTRAGARSG